MGKFQDFTGRTFGYWTVMHAAPPIGKATAWWAQCICGAGRLVRAGHLRNGASTNCGCKRVYSKPPRSKPRHGACVARNFPGSYRAWRYIRARTVNPSAARRPDAKHYVAKGVTLCERWLKYENFAADMGEPPSPKHEIDRLDSAGNYEPGNCRWATAKEQVADLPQNQKGYRCRRVREQEGTTV